MRIYAGMCADLLHHGHINLLTHAEKYGDVIVGLLTDEAIATYKNPPAMTYEQRKVVVESLRMVHSVYPQKTLSYKNNLEIIRPEYVIHADNWQTGKQAHARREVVETIRRWDGILIEIPYTEGISSTLLREKYLRVNTE